MALEITATHTRELPLPSTFSLLARNLRLLNLDQLDDWPGLTKDTFAFKDDVRAKSKVRLQSAEWLLFRLFELWDPQVTKAVCLNFKRGTTITRTVLLVNDCFILSYKFSSQDCYLYRFVISRSQI